MILEVGFIVLVILIQFWVFRVTRKDLSELENIFPERKEYELVLASFSEAEASQIDGDTLAAILLSNKEKVIEVNNGGFDLNLSPTKQILIDLINPKPTFSALLLSIVRSTNTYLVRNKNHAADFKIIRELADREVDAQENQVDTTINLPLYLGLLGTIAGIVLGLWELAPLGDFISGGTTSDDLLNNIENEIPALLGSVSFAMIASFFGLGLTIYSNGVSYKNALKKCNTKKNEYFTFIQTELLPILTKDMNSSLNTLQSNLNNFNEKFNTNIEKFSSATEKIQENLKVQRDFLNKLNKIGYNKLIESNLDLFNKINKSSKQFSLFIEYQERLNEAIKSADAATERLYGLIHRFKQFEENADVISGELKTTFTKNGELLSFLKNNYGEFEVRENAMRGLITQLDNTFQKSVEVISNRSKEEFDNFRSFTIEELNAIQKAYENSRPQFKQLSFLKEIDEKIGQLGELNKSLLRELEKQSKIREKSFNANEGGMVKSLSQINHSIDKLVALNSKKPYWMSVWNKIKKWFVR